MVDHLEDEEEKEEEEEEEEEEEKEKSVLTHTTQDMFALQLILQQNFEAAHKHVNLNTTSETCP